MLLLIVKFIFYCVWCFVGIRYLKLNYKHPLPMSILFGFSRTLLGFGLLLAFLLGSFVFYGIGNIYIRGIFIYVFIAIPLRWFEWSVVDLIMNRDARKLNFLIKPASEKSLRWRLGGMVLNLIFDVPLILFTSHDIFNFSMC